MAQLEIYETEQAVLLHANLPEITHVHAKLGKNTLLLTGEEQGRSFLQTITLPHAVCAELAIIVHEDDELRIIAPKDNDKETV